MWGTYITERFGLEEAEAVRDSLDSLLGPDSGSGWSTGGVYVFWQPSSREPLYVGITGDLPIRFAQHTGLRSCPADKCKRVELQAYFDQEDELGYTILPMSSLDQISTERHRKRLGLEDEGLFELDEALSAEAVDECRTLEGRLLSSGTFDLLLQSRRSLRELSADPEAAMFEENLHSARFFAVIEATRNGLGYRNDLLRKWLKEGPIMPELRERILESGYLDQRCPLTIGRVLDPPTGIEDTA